MTAPPYMRWYPSDYLGDTTHLNRDEHGAYFLLLQACWLRGGKLVDDDQVLATITLCTHGEWPGLRQKLAPFFKISRGVWRQKRLSRELNDALRLRRQQSIGGQKTAAKRWTNNNKTRNSSANSSATSPANSSATSSPHSSANSTATATPAPTPEPEILPPQPPLVNEGGRRARGLKKSPRTVQMEAFAYAAAQRAARTSNC